MDFNFDTDLAIFNPLLARRPEIDQDKLKIDLENYYLPYLKKLIAIYKQRLSTEGLIVGVSAIQGAGKTTQGEIVEVLLKHLGFNSVHLSLDDHYLTHLELSELQKKDPRFIRRGVTHDIVLALRDLHNLKTMSDQPILISGYDKGAHHGAGDRFKFINPIPKLIQNFTIQDQTLILVSATFEGKLIKLPDNMGASIRLDEPNLPMALNKLLESHSNRGVELIIENGHAEFKTHKDNFPIDLSHLPNGWNLVTEKPNFVFYDGWMLGVRPAKNERVFETQLPALEKPEDQQFAKDVNKKLVNYQPLWEMINFMNVLYVPNYQISITWRDQAEQKLRAKGEGMSPQEIIDFVHYFWRSVHPAIQIENLIQDHNHSQQVVVINDDHSIKGFLNRT